jgi:hypothetical protein
MPLNTTDPQSHRTAAILTDIHFWVPVVVLLAGLLLLRSIQ